MEALGQCADILNLTSLDWKKSRIAMVAHSFRVMSRARNFDEMVVGIMHHVYASSSYARGLFNCDVYGNCIWKDALDLFVERQKRLKSTSFMDLPDEVLLGLNMDQRLRSECGMVEAWMDKECRWSPGYKKKLERIGVNRIARNVMIYDLEDKLEILMHPERFPEEGSDTLVLPWKKEYVVEVFRGRHCITHTRIPDTDDGLFQRPLTYIERTDLIEKYSRGVVMLMRMRDDDDQGEGDFSDEEKCRASKACMDWYGQWLAKEMALEEMYGDEENLNQ